MSAKELFSLRLSSRVFVEEQLYRDSQFSGSFQVIPLGEVDYFHPTVRFTLGGGYFIDKRMSVLLSDGEGWASFVVFVESDGELDKILDIVDSLRSEILGELGVVAVPEGGEEGVGEELPIG
jgi:hypothetical protein